MIINLGCGLKKFSQHSAETEFGCERKDVLYVDNLKSDEIDINQDIIQFLKSTDKKITGVLLSHVMEHFHPEEQINILNLLYDKMGNGDRVIIYCPHYSSAIAKTHLTHKKLIGWNTFDNFEPDSLEKYSDSVYKIKKKLIMGKVFKLFEPLFNKYPAFYEQYISSHIPAREVRFELMVIK